jgi:hypothetical protein
MAIDDRTVRPIGRLAFIAGAVTMLAAPFAVEAQQAGIPDWVSISKRAL